jgi:hypothetical protein
MGQSERGTPGIGEGKRDGGGRRMRQREGESETYRYEDLGKRDDKADKRRTGSSGVTGAGNACVYNCEVALVVGDKCCHACSDLKAVGKRVEIQVLGFMV